MVHLRTAAALVGAVAATLVAASTTPDYNNAPLCGPGNSCPEDAPCCSQYGLCGVGAYCLGGCDPIHSFNLESCMPAPVCSSADYKLTSLDDIVPNTQYLGDASNANWVSSGTPVAYQDQSVLLTMAPSTVGTLLTSTRYVWYGKISATLSTSQGAGVVTAFIMMSDVKDEIDFEFVGVDLTSAQSNYYWQGVLDYNNEVNLTVSDTRANMHTYEFDWTPDSITWSIDGNAMRTLNRNDTWNATSQAYHFPQTPARIELSLWPAGLSSNGEGTVNWAGGLVDWNSPYMQNGYYYAVVNDVTVECYNPPSGYNNSGNQAYRYTNENGFNNSVSIINTNTTLASFYADGNDPSDNPNASKTGSSSSQPTVQTVPGDSGAGAYSESGSPADGASGNTGSSSGSSGSDGSGGFSQGLGSKSGADTLKGQRLHAAEGGSLIAFVVAVVALMVL